MISTARVTRRSSARTKRSVQRPVTNADTQVSPPNTALRQDLGENPLRSSGRHCEANALSHRNNRGVDTDDPPARIHQRSARITRIERCRVLNDAFYEPAVPTSKRAPQRAHDARGHC